LLGIYIMENFPKKKKIRIGVDGQAVSVSRTKAIQKDLKKLEAEFVTNDLIDEIWRDRPSYPSEKIMVYEKYSDVKAADKIEKIRFPDHHNYKKSDLQKIEFRFNSITSSNKIIITSEKDAMRLHKFTNIADNIKKSFFYIPIKVRFLNNKTDNFNKQITDYVRNNKKHSFLYPK